MYSETATKTARVLESDVGTDGKTRYVILYVLPNVLLLPSRKVPTTRRSVILLYKVTQVSVILNDEIVLKVARFLVPIICDLEMHHSKTDVTNKSRAAVDEQIKIFLKVGSSHEVTGALTMSGNFNIIKRPTVQS